MAEKFVFGDTNYITQSNLILASHLNSMKNTTLFIFILVSLSKLGALAQTDTTWYDFFWDECTKNKAFFFRPEPVKQGDLYYVTDYYLDGTKQFEGYFVSAKAEVPKGEVIWYYPSGDTSTISNFENSSAEGWHKDFYGENKLARKMMMGNNARNGLCELYYHNGQLKSEATYKDDELNGEYVSYHRNGALKEKGTYKLGEKVGHWAIYLPDGTTQTEFTLNDKGKADGKIIDNGVEYTTLKGEVKGDRVISLEATQERGNYKTRITAKEVNGIEEWKLYWHDALVMEYYYKGKERVGTWKMYSADGSQVVETLEHKGEGIVDKSFDSDDMYMPSFKTKTTYEELLDDFFVSDNFNAHYTLYDAEGRLWEEGDYVNGEKADNWKEYLTDPVYPKYPEFSEARSEWKSSQIRVEDGLIPDLAEELVPKASVGTFTTDDGQTAPLLTFQFEGIQFKCTYGEKNHLANDDLFEMARIVMEGFNAMIVNLPEGTGKGENNLFWFVPGEMTDKLLQEEIVDRKELAAAICQALPDRKLSKHEIYKKIQDSYNDPFDGWGDSEDIVIEEIPITEQEIFDEEIPVGYWEEPGDQVYTIVEVMPKFPGGDDSLYNFIGANVEYPANEVGKHKNNVKVIAKFVVTKDGSVDDIEIVKGELEAFNNEVIRVLKLLPKFNPGTQRGRPVNVQFVLPVTFAPPPPKGE